MSLSAYQLRLWSIAVRRRDKRCRVCGSFQRLQAHHLNHKTYYPEDAYDVSKGITLCATDKSEGLQWPGHKCHIIFHTLWMPSTRHKCNIEDFEEFVRMIRWAQQFELWPGIGEYA